MNGKVQNDIHNIILNHFNKNASIIFFCCTPDGVILQTNSYTEKMIGRDVVNNSIKDFFVDFHNAFDFLSFAGDSNKIYLLNITTKSGMPQTFYFRFYRLDSQIVVIGETDVEEMENLRRNLILLNNELNNKTRELIKANKELENLNNIKNQLLSMAAHDLRTPIGAIRSFSEFLLEETSEKLDVEHIHFLTTIMSLSDFMLRLLNDLLDVSIIEMGKIKLELKQTDIVSLIKESIDVLSVFSQKKSITVEFSPQEFPYVYVDPIRIRQVIDNLLNNAIKFSPQNSKVTIEVSEHDEDRLKISILDEGKGILEEEMDRLFKPLSYTSNQPTGGERKTGLGLSIAKKIIDAHGGRIYVKNRLQGGAEFYFFVNKVKETNKEV